MRDLKSKPFTISVKAVSKSELESALRVLVRSFEINSISIRKSEAERGPERGGDTLG